MINRPDFILFTDGSGHVDGYGGWACWVKCLLNDQQMYRAGSMIGTTTDRMEFTAMLEALQLALEMAPGIPRKNSMFEDKWKPRVHIFSDRENLVLSISRVYGRSNAADLWKRFEFYESVMHVEAFHVTRENDYPEFIQVDLDASSGRILIKDFAEKCKHLARDYGILSDVPPHQLAKP